jgi:hypothetical protein
MQLLIFFQGMYPLFSQPHLLEHPMFQRGFVSLNNLQLRMSFTFIENLRFITVQSLMCCQPDDATENH